MFREFSAWMMAPTMQKTMVVAVQMKGVIVKLASERAGTLVIPLEKSEVGPIAMEPAAVRLPERFGGVNRPVYVKMDEVIELSESAPGDGQLLAKAEESAAAVRRIPAAAVEKARARAQVL